MNLKFRKQEIVTILNTFWWAILYSALLYNIVHQKVFRINFNLFWQSKWHARCLGIIIKVHISASSLFWLIIPKSGLLAGNRKFADILKSQRILCVLFSSTDSGLWIVYDQRIIIILLFWDGFHTSVTWWLLTGVWVTEVSSGLQDSSQYSDRS